MSHFRTKHVLCWQQVLNTCNNHLERRLKASLWTTVIVVFPSCFYYKSVCLSIICSSICIICRCRFLTCLLSNVLLFICLLFILFVCSFFLFNCCTCRIFVVVVYSSVCPMLRKSSLITLLLKFWFDFLQYHEWIMSLDIYLKNKCFSF